MTITNNSNVFQQAPAALVAQSASTPSKIKEIKSVPQERKQVRFNLDNVTIKEIPSLDDYNFIQLYHLYYKQSDLDYFQRHYEMNGPVVQDKATIRSLRTSRKMSHLIVKQKNAVKRC